MTRDERDEIGRELRNCAKAYHASNYRRTWEAAADLLEAAPDPRREELAAWCDTKAAWYLDRAEKARSAHGVRDTYHTDADCATKIAALLRGGR